MSCWKYSSLIVDITSTVVRTFELFSKISSHFFIHISSPIMTQSSEDMLEHIFDIIYLPGSFYFASSFGHSTLDLCMRYHPSFPGSH
mmetsp:Transcript_42696/g.51272  ORF Transcript_42696/g.51272 Transcript_42696/m.51272 type:complete len:87 (-) Transcript_42696:125-385(-)